jgi:hypothetical protein
VRRPRDTFHRTQSCAARQRRPPSAQTQHLIARGSNPFEDAVYVGLPALALLIVSAWIGLLSGVLISLLALGSGAHGAFWTGLSHLFAPLLALPVASSIVPQRFGLLLDLLAAFWLARLTDDAVRRFATRQVLAAGAVLAGVALVLVSWVPAPPADQVTWEASTFGTSVDGHDAVLRPGSCGTGRKP